MHHRSIFFVFYGGVRHLCDLGASSACWMSIVFLGHVGGIESVGGDVLYFFSWLIYDCSHPSHGEGRVLIILTVIVIVCVCVWLFMIKLYSHKSLRMRALLNPHDTCHSDYVGITVWGIPFFVNPTLIKSIRS
jgi:hypothetical protein